MFSLFYELCKIVNDLMVPHYHPISRCRVHSSGAHSGVCIVLRRRDDVKVPEMGSLCPLVRPQLNISHNLGDIELLITTNYSHFPRRNEAHDNGSVTLVHLVHCVNKHTPTFPIVLRTIMNISMRRLQQLILIFRTIEQLSQCPFLTQAVHYNIIPYHNVSSQHNHLKQQSIRFK